MTRTPAQLVDHYLQLCEDRDLQAAAELLAPAARLQFPGAVEYSSLADLVSGATSSYAWVRKHRDRFFTGAQDGQVTVTSVGRLYGERVDGSPFQDIRYVDVFVIEDGLIREQLVWNDLCVAGIGPRSTDPAPTQP